MYLLQQVSMVMHVTHFPTDSKQIAFATDSQILKCCIALSSPQPCMHMAMLPSSRLFCICVFACAYSYAAPCV